MQPYIMGVLCDSRCAKWGLLFLNVSERRVYRKAKVLWEKDRHRFAALPELTILIGVTKQAHH